MYVQVIQGTGRMRCGNMAMSPWLVLALVNEMLAVLLERLSDLHE
jgi:hypothetical protein